MAQYEAAQHRSGDTADGRPTELGAGRYVDLEQVAEGAMATVFRARDAHTGEARAIKILSERLAFSPEWRSRFLAEARALLALHHPHVLRVHDVGFEDDKWLYLVMSLASGSLHDRFVQGEPGDPIAALDRTFELLMGLSAVHALGMVHRDIKPANVLISEQGACWLGDFGVARVHALLPVEHRTRTGQVLGTLGYEAPEMRLDPRAAEVSADIYAVGGTLYALVAGVEPPDLALAGRVSMAYSGLPAPVVDIIHRATAYDPADRYTDTRDMARAVATARDALAGTRELEAKMEEFDGALQPRPAWVVPAAIGAGLAVLFLGIAFALLGTA